MVLKLHSEVEFEVFSVRFSLEVAVVVVGCGGGGGGADHLNSFWGFLEIWYFLPAV